MTGSPQNFLFAIALGLLAVGCTPVEPDAASTLSGAEDPSQKTVLTTFTILADMAQAVAGDELTVESITRVGAEIHGYEPVPSDIAKAQNADLILANGMDLERWFEQFIGNLDDVPTVVLTDGVEPIAIAEGPYGGKPNPHAWMSPSKCTDICRETFVRPLQSSTLTMRNSTMPTPPPTANSSTQSMLNFNLTWLPSLSRSDI